MQQLDPRPGVRVQTTRLALNRIVASGKHEGVVLREAARSVDGAERQGRLLQQARRRDQFESELRALLVELGGPSLSSGSALAPLSAWGRALWRALAGPHQGDAYAACALAAESSVAAYTKALAQPLSAELRSGLERELLDVAADAKALGRLRWGEPLAEARPCDEGHRTALHARAP